MVGTNNLESAVKFYDQLMPKMNMIRVELSNDFAAYSLLNKSENTEIVANCHRAGIDAGGKDEGAPGYRPVDGNIYAYVRDLDGNKVWFVHDKRCS